MKKLPEALLAPPVISAPDLRKRVQAMQREIRDLLKKVNAESERLARLESMCLAEAKHGQKSDRGALDDLAGQLLELHSDHLRSDYGKSEHGNCVRDALDSSEGYLSELLEDRGLLADYEAALKKFTIEARVFAERKGPTR